MRSETIDSNPSGWILPGTERCAVAIDGPLMAAVDHFRDHPDRRILPIIDAAGMVVGAVLADDIRSMLFNPFGHALLSNPAYAQGLSGLIRDCPMADVHDDAAAILNSYGRAVMDDGMILTRGGRLAGVVTNRMLVRIAMVRERRWSGAQAGRLERMNAIAVRFDADARAMADLLTRIGTDLLDCARTGSERATRSMERVATLVDGAERTDRKIGTLAEQTRAMAESLTRLSSESSDARGTTRDALQVASLATMRTGELATAAQSIEGMLALIRSVATKANRLALNATIEAARAGPAGRSFAVVADEVKALAAQTKNATSRIDGQIAAILAMVDEVASGQAVTREVVATVDHLTGSVDAAVGAQRTVIGQVAESAEAAREASQTISAIFVEVRSEAERSLAHSGQIEDMAQQLTERAERLRNAVGTLLSRMCDA